MKKVFLSVPMKGRHKDDIMLSLEKMKAYAKIAFQDEELEFINTIVKDNPPETANKSIWYLGASLQLLSEADILVTVDCPYFLNANGVAIEQHVFRDYKPIETPIIKLPISMIMSKDEYDTLKKQYEEIQYACPKESN